MESYQLQIYHLVFQSINWELNYNLFNHLFGYFLIILKIFNHSNSFELPILLQKRNQMTCQIENQHRKINYISFLGWSLNSYLFCSGSEITLWHYTFYLELNDLVKKSLFLQYSKEFHFLKDYAFLNCQKTWWSNFAF